MGYCSLHIAKEKIKNNASGSSHLNNDGKHILRKHLDPEKVKNVDSTRSHLNDVLVDKYGLAGDSEKTLWSETKKDLEDRGIKIRNSETIVCNKIVLGMPAGKHSDKDIQEWSKKSMEFLNDKFGKENITVAAVHKDEKQIHIEAYFIPVVDGKLNYKKLCGGHLPEASKKMSDLQDEYAKYYRPLGYERGNGLNTNGLSKKAYQASMAYVVKTDLEQSKIPAVDEVGFFNKSDVIEQLENKVNTLEKNNNALKQAARKSYYYKEKAAGYYSSARSFKKRATSAEKKVFDFEAEKKKLISDYEKKLKAADRNYSQLENDQMDLRKKYTNERDKNRSLQRELDILKNPEFQEALQKLEERKKLEKIEEDNNKKILEAKNPKPTAPKPTPK